MQKQGTTSARVVDYPDLRKINHSYVVNTNKSHYQTALMRHKRTRKIDTMEQRVTTIEEQIGQILAILQNKKEE